MRTAVSARSTPSARSTRSTRSARSTREQGGGGEGARAYPSQHRVHRSS
ncbi:hypothetical protein ACPXCS_18720 [Streptomyces sp. DT190]